jgi:CheY-like chemotaxis protein
LEEVFALLRTQLRGDAIDVEKHYTSPTLLFGDKAQLHQVFLNLAVNARHAMRPKGKGVITVAIENTKKEVRVEFSDTGIGMRPEEAHHAFEPFFTTKGPLGGGPLPEEQISPTGLGLSLVHTILQSHGGSIDLDTTPGRGTTFTVLLPRVPHEREAGDPSAQSAHSTSLAGRHVLIAMEDAAFRQLLEELACSRGGDATGVERGSAVLNTLDRRGWDLLFLDCSLPGIHVEELLFEIRRSFPYLQYVLFSDPPLTEDKKRRFEVAGAAGILPKSFHLAEIDRLLSSLFSEPQETVSPET